MLKQYRDGTFSRDRLQWARCVVKYTLDSFDPNTLELIIFITEVLKFVSQT